MRTHIRTLCTIFLAVLSATSALADGILLPVHQPRGDVFSVKYHHVDVFIDGQAATTKVDQMFHNETAVQEEGTYIFPLPKGAAIHKFSMFIGEQEEQGKILDKDEARRLYESIVRQRKDPALLEYMDRNTFRARVYPIPPHGDKRIRLEYTEVVGKTGTLCRYVYPLSTERFSAKPLEDVRVTIRLKSGSPISNIYSPSHVVKIDQTRPREATVTWTAKDVKPDQDLILYYSLGESEVGLDVMAYRERGEKGYFMLLASPKVDTDGRVLPKSVVFVLDRTGSMAGEKIVQAKAALKYCLNSLKPQDEFSVITFNESPDVLWEDPKLASKANVEKALDFVDRVDASGGTNLNAAILRALGKSWETGMRNFIVVLTDGLPTVGEQNVETILKNVKGANRSKARVFTFGVGYDVNTHLLDLLAEQSGGQPEYVLPSEDIEAKVSSFFAGVSEPVLTDLKLNVSGVRVSEVYPTDELPDLFKGGQLIVLGRYDGQGQASFTLSGKTSKGHRSWKTEVKMPGRDDEKDFIPQIWAARKIGYLLDQVRLHRSDELIEEIVRLSKEWGIPTEFTSFFVDEPTPVPLSGALHRARKAMSEARDAVSGSWGVSQSMNYSSLKSQAQVMATPGAAPMGPQAGVGGRLGNTRAYFDAEGRAVAVNTIQNIGTRTFYQRGSQWVDNQVEDRNLPRVQIKQFSNAHFKLLAAYPELAKYQRLGNMSIMINNQSVEFGSEGKDDLTDAEVKAILGSVRAGTPPLVAGLSQEKGQPWVPLAGAVILAGLLSAIGRLSLHRFQSGG
jgi:Ca-activated chloride channel family protein